jgi:hypothetical protein
MPLVGICPFGRSSRTKVLCRSEENVLQMFPKPGKTFDDGARANSETLEILIERDEPNVNHPVKIFFGEFITIHFRERA